MFYKETSFYDISNASGFQVRSFSLKVSNEKFRDEIKTRTKRQMAKSVFDLLTHAGVYIIL